MLVVTGFGVVLQRLAR